MEALENLVLSKKEGIAYFSKFPAQSGITTVNFGSCQLNGEQEPRLNQSLVKLLQVGFFNKLIPKHSDKIELIRHYYGKGYHECDSIIFIKESLSNYQQHSLLISNTADCPVVLLAYPPAGLTAIVHSGWRGTRKNIVGKTVARLLSAKTSIAAKDLFAFVWPGICGKCYQVGPEFKTYFPGQVDQGKLNLKSLLIEQLEKAGLKKITSTNACSYCTTVDGQPLFHSHRREANGLRNCVFIA